MSTEMRRDIMLAYPFEEKRLLKWTPPYICQPKLDGIRCRAILDNDRNAHLVSSEGNDLNFAVPHIVEALQASGLRNIELDGELYTHGMDFSSIVSIAKRTTDIHNRYFDLEFHIFDIISYELQGLRTSQLYDLRINTYRIEPLLIVPFQLAENLDEIMALLELYIADDYEGIIIRDFSAPYVRKRSTRMMKFKPRKEDIYEVVAYQEEVSKDGVPKGTLGALVCKSPSSDELFKVGSGFSAEQRKELWHMRVFLPGHFVRIKYQHMTPGRGVPRFPIFAEIFSEH